MGGSFQSKQKLSEWGGGGAVHTVFQCTRCSRHYTFDNTILPEQPTAGQNHLSKAMQVAFITAGLTHATYKKVLDILGMAVVSFLTFQGTIQELHPIVEQMVKEMCQHEKERMKGMDHDKLFSWSKAVTCADGTWQTRGYHRKNATFTIRNYANGALLYFVHLCQRGEDNLINEPLYQGTSKSAEGYGASRLMKKAKEEGLQISVHWQDANSTASKHVKEVYPKALIMICGGHAGKVTSNSCSYEPNRRPSLRRQRRRYSSFQTSRLSSVTAKKRKRSPAKQARKRPLKGVKVNTECKKCSQKPGIVVIRRCDFHPLVECSCGKCDPGQDLNCGGKPYHTKEILNCRIEMANQLAHSTMKRGHSNWLEASHNVLIRYRLKHLYLERLHYHVSINLGLLQANMTCE